MQTIKWYYLVLPLKLCPHAPKLGLGAGGRHDVVHNVDVNIIEDDYIAVAGRPLHVVYDVAKDDSVLRRGNLDVCLDIGKIVGCQNNGLKKKPVKLRKKKKKIHK